MTFADSRLFRRLMAGVAVLALTGLAAVPGAAVANAAGCSADSTGYDANCLDGFSNVKGTLATSVTFTDSTHWHSNGGPGATATTTTLYVTPGEVGFLPVSGSGSGSQAIDQWRRRVAQDGITVNFAANDATTGRNDFRTGRTDFAISEIPYDGGVLDQKPARAFGYLPIMAGGPAFTYNLKIGNKRVTNLRLSGESLTKIFTQKITNWSDPLIKADNPGLVLPNRQIVPVVRSDGAGITAQFTAWMASRYGGLWDAYCRDAGRDITPCGSTSYYPLTSKPLNAKAGSPGVVGFVAQDSSEGTITYAEYSYARNAGLPVVKVLNAGNYYVEPTATNVAVALLKARINADLSQDLSQVYVDSDPRAYPLSSYGYMIIPKDTTANFNAGKGRTLSEFAYYSLCAGQRQADAPLPVNLVRAAIDQVGQIPGSTHQLSSTDLHKCDNPTFSPDGADLLSATSPQPKPCDRKGALTQCATATGGARATAPPRSPLSPGVPGTAGAAVTLTAVVTPPIASGSVQFTDGTTNIGDPVTVTDGTASTTTSTLTVGSHQLSAVFTPTDPAFDTSRSSTVAFVVNTVGEAKATTCALTVFPNRAVQGIPVVLLANVAPGGAAGTIQFKDGTTALGPPVPLASGFALRITSLPAGTRSLTAVFTPTNPAAFAPSTSTPVSRTVNPLLPPR